MTNMRPPKNTMMKVVILGDGGVGKSCLINRFVSNHFDDHSFHTIGVEFLNKDIEVDQNKYTLQIWDTAGQERFRALRTPFYRGSDICMLTYAINDKTSFKNLHTWREEFLKYADVKAENFPFIVVGNKNDLLDSERKVAAEEVSIWCQEFNIPSFIEASAKNSTNVYDAFVLAVRQWQKLEKATERELKAQNGGDTIDLTRTVTLNKSSKFCCFGGGNSNSQNQISSD